MARGKARRGGKRDPLRAVERQQAWEERQDAVCAGKSGRYPTEVEARQAAGRVKAENPGQQQMRVYECQRCGMWHLTRG